MDFTNKDEVLAALKETNSQKEYNLISDKVKQANYNSYPWWWGEDVLIPQIKGKLKFKWEQK